MPQTICIHVSASARGKADGTAAHPYPTLQAARDAIRKLRDAQDTPAGITVRVGSGEYRLTESLMFGSEDSGTERAPIVYRAEEGATVRLMGGARLDPVAFMPVTDSAVRARLSEQAREHVVQIDLRAQGITDCGAFTSRGFSRKTVPSHLELFFNDRPMVVAQWPDAGQFATITGSTKPIKTEWGAPSGELTGGFTYEGDRPRRWAPSDNIWVHGYWAYDWANSYERVRRLDPVERVVETVPPHGNYYFTQGQRFYFLNVLEELDQPGEYYVDGERGILYFWPPAPLAGAEILISLLNEPLLAFKEARHLEFRGFTLEAGRDCGIRVEGGEGLAIAGCVIRNCGTWAVQITGGSRHTVAGCDFYGVGDGGISVNGGDRATLKPCNHAVLNNHIHHFARWSRCYVAGIGASGVGMRFANNLIHDAPHNAILFWGNDFLIENNEIHRVCLETGDAGAIYTGRDYTFRGNVIRRNFIHHMGGVGMGSIAIYMDDCVSGTTIAENILWDCQYGLMLGGGRDFVVENNVFVGCRPAISADSRGVDPSPVWQDMVNQTMRKSLEAMRHHEPPYSVRYPEIADVDPYLAGGKGVPPANNRVERNICWRCDTWITKGWPKEPDKGVTERNNLVGVDPGFTDEAFGVLSLRPESPAWALGFQPIPLDEIGLVVDRDRTSIPPRVRAALQLQATPAADKPVRLRLLVRNDGAVTARGTLVAECSGIVDAVLTGDTRLAYCLPPGDAACHELSATASLTAASNWTGTLTVRVSSPDSRVQPAQLPIPWPHTRRASAWLTDGWQVSRLLPAADIATAPYVGLAQEAGWTPVPQGQGFVSIHDLRGPTGIVHLARRVRAARDGEWTLHIGHDGGARVFVDGRPVAATPGTVNPAPLARTAARVALAAGEHEISIALDRADGRGWGLFACFEVPAERLLPGTEPEFPA